MFLLNHYSYVFSIIGNRLSLSLSLSLSLCFFFSLSGGGDLDDGIKNFYYLNLCLASLLANKCQSGPLKRKPSQHFDLFATSCHTSTASLFKGRWYQCLLREREGGFKCLCPIPNLSLYDCQSEVKRRDKKLYTYHLSGDDKSHYHPVAFPATLFLIVQASHRQAGFIHFLPYRCFLKKKKWKLCYSFFSFMKTLHVPAAVLIRSLEWKKKCLPDGGSKPVPQALKTAPVTTWPRKLWLMRWQTSYLSCNTHRSLRYLAHLFLFFFFNNFSVISSLF